MKKLLTLSAMLFICGIAFSQIYTPNPPTAYGSNFNRVNPWLVLHVPESLDTTLNSNIMNAQIRSTLGELYWWNRTRWQKIGGGATPPAGANREIQFNNLGAFGASPNFTWNEQTKSVILQSTGNIQNIQLEKSAPNSQTRGDGVGISFRNTLTGRRAIIELIASTRGGPPEFSTLKFWNYNLNTDQWLSSFEISPEGVAVSNNLHTQDIYMEGSNRIAWSNPSVGNVAFLGQNAQTNGVVNMFHNRSGTTSWRIDDNGDLALAAPKVYLNSLVGTGTRTVTVAPDGTLGTGDAGGGGGTPVVANDLNVLIKRFGAITTPGLDSMSWNPNGVSGSSGFLNLLGGLRINASQASPAFGVNPISFNVDDANQWRFFEVTGSIGAGATAGPYMVLRNGQSPGVFPPIGSRVSQLHFADWGANVASISAFMTQDHTGAAKGTDMRFSVTNNGRNVQTEHMRLGASGALLIGTLTGALGDTASVNALLELRSTSRGFLMPRMSTTQKENMNGPQTGLAVYDINEGRPSYRAPGQWRNVAYQDELPPVAFEESPYVSTTSSNPTVIKRIQIEDNSVGTIEFNVSGITPLGFVIVGKRIVNYKKINGVLNFYGVSTIGIINRDAPLITASFNIAYDNNDAAIQVRGTALNIRWKASYIKTVNK